MPFDPSPLLRQLQARFYALATSAPEAGTPAGLVRGDERLDAAARVGVYANMYAVRLRDVLADDFPKLHAVLGDERFDTLAARYVRARPPAHPSLRYLGTRLAAFLVSDELGREQPWLADLARLEWARVDAFDAADADALALAALAALPAERWPGLVLQLVPAARFVELTFAVDDAWAAIEANSTPVLPPHAAVRTVVVWRRDLAVIHRTVDDAEALALKLVAGGVRFANVCERLGEGLDTEAAAARAFTCVSRWATAGLLASGTGVGAAPRLAFARPRAG